MFHRILIPVAPGTPAARATTLIRFAAQHAAPEAQLILAAVCTYEEEERAGVPPDAPRADLPDGMTVETLFLRCANPEQDAGPRLVGAVQESKADLVVMSSHRPGRDEVFASHAGYVAAHAPVSVFVLRQDGTG